MEELNMEYNSQRDKLAIPEYGRNIQKLIQHAQAIEDPEYRQAFVEMIVKLMMQMHPQNRNFEDYKIKLWKHVFRIADYKLDVLPPNGKVPLPEDFFKKPEKVGYPAMTAAFRHYGSNVQRLIKKALAMEEGPLRDGFVAVIGSYMKLAYKTWNKDLYVSDEIIRRDLNTLSKGQLTLDENISLDNLSQANRHRKRSSDRDRNNGSNSHYLRQKGKGRGRRK